MGQRVGHRNMASKSILIDCDPGVDDAIALMLALRSPELTVEAITVVAGNVPLDLTQANARRICELMKRSDLPVYAGCPRPMLRPLITAAHVHGKTGLDGANLPAPEMPLCPQHGVNALIQQVLAAPEPITIATLGPLTNLAIALIQAPRLIDHIAEVVVMGGGLTFGNVTPVAEFNIYVDPHAARVVFEAGLPMTLISLDVTHQVLTTPDRLSALRSLGTPASQVAAAMLAHYGKTDCATWNLLGPPLHDPCVIAYLIAPDLFHGEPGHVAVETDSLLTLGQTVVSSPPQDSPLPPVNVIKSVDADGLYRLLCDRLAIA